MSASSRRTVTVVVAALGVAFIMVLAATTGPDGMIGELPTSETIDATRDTSTDPLIPPKAPADKQPFEKHSHRPGDWLQDLFYLALLLLGLWVAAGARAPRRAPSRPRAA